MGRRASARMGARASVVEPRGLVPTGLRSSICWMRSRMASAHPTCAVGSVGNSSGSLAGHAAAGSVALLVVWLGPVSRDGGSTRPEAKPASARSAASSGVLPAKDTEPKSPSHSTRKGRASLAQYVTCTCSGASALHKALNPASSVTREGLGTPRQCPLGSASAIKNLPCEAAHKCFGVRRFELGER